jgi:hypothetical protein
MANEHSLINVMPLDRMTFHGTLPELLNTPF